MENTPAADFETAVHFAKNGRFQKLLLAVCGTVYATCAISTTTLSFVLPSAECDFNLSSMDKGKLSATPLIGMVLGCAVWGAIADSRGRKLALILSLLVDFSAAITSSLAMSFHLFLICRFFNGFGIIGATNIIFSYLGEFLSVKNRDAMLGKLEIFWNFGIVVLPAFAWSLLSVPVHKSFCYQANFSPWRIFVLICGIPSLLSAAMLWFLPETPKYLMSKEKFEEARQVFQKMYVWNTRNPSCIYPVLTLEGELENNNVVKTKRCTLVRKIKNKCSAVLNSLKVLFSQPYLRYLAITSFADFGLMMSYYTLIMWFPEIFSRFYEFEVQHPNLTAGIVEVFQNNATRNNIFFSFLPCDPSIDFRVFLDTFIIGLSCIPTSVSLSYFMKKVGKISVLVFCLMTSGLATLSLIWVRSTWQTLVLSCFFEALTSILESVLFCVVVDLFPTNLRAIALAITAMSGRLGAILGNIIFGILIDINCLIPIYLFGLLLFASGLLCLAIPRTENYIVIH
ncbi:synaptic vesicle glycoprotein 2B isoform X2 [Leptinotarsa decemlineata]